MCNPQPCKGILAFALVVQASRKWFASVNHCRLEHVHLHTIFMQYTRNMHTPIFGGRKLGELWCCFHLCRPGQTQESDQEEESRGDSHTKTQSDQGICEDLVVLTGKHALHTFALVGTAFHICVHDLECGLGPHTQATALRISYRSIATVFTSSTLGWNGFCRRAMAVANPRASPMSTLRGFKPFSTRR